jgi:hypothetical protein
VPDDFPRNATDIREAHDLDTNEVWMRFRVDLQSPPCPGARWWLPKRCRIVSTDQYRTNYYYCGLEHFVVTLDPRSGFAYFDEYRGGPFVEPSFGFGLAFDDGVAVSLVWADSPAARAGLQVGQRLMSIQGEPTDSTCEAIRRALRAMSGETIELAWDGGDATLIREAGTTPR